MAAPIFPAAAEIPWQVALTYNFNQLLVCTFVGKDSLGKTNVTVFGPPFEKKNVRPYKIKKIAGTFTINLNNAPMKI
jgi:hypothetical protein